MLLIFSELIPLGIIQGLILGSVALGIFIPFRLLNFPDLTSEGSYPLGGIFCAFLLTKGINPFQAIVISAFISGCMGMGTACIHIFLKVNTLLAGIILSTMIYSINLRLMGKPNLALFEYSTIFKEYSGNFSAQGILILSFISIIMIFLFFFLKTEKGLRFRAVGLNPIFSERQTIPLTQYILFGLFMGNALCGLAGGLMVQLQEYADINMGVGIVIHGLAALMIGESLIKGHTLIIQLISPLLGALIYQQIQGLAISCGLEPTDLEFFTGCIVLMVIALKFQRKERFLI